MEDAIAEASPSVRRLNNELTQLTRELDYAVQTRSRRINGEPRMLRIGELNRQIAEVQAERIGPSGARVELCRMICEQRSEVVAPRHWIRGEILALCELGEAAV